MINAWSGALRGEGYAFIPGAAFRPVLGSLPDWGAFARSWGRLVLDEHLPYGHRYRRRRHGTLRAGPRPSTRPAAASWAASRPAWRDVLVVTYKAA